MPINLTESPTDPKYSLVSYDKTSIQLFASDNLAEILAQVVPERVSWLTVSGYNPADRADVEQVLAHFAVTPELARDIFDRTLLDFSGEQPDYLYVEYALPQFNASKTGYQHARGSAVLGQDYLLLFNEKKLGLFDQIRQRVLAGTTRAQKYGPDYLLYLLIRVVAGNLWRLVYVDLVEQFEELEDKVIASHGQDFILDKIIAQRELVKPLYDSVRRLSDIIDFVLQDESRFITPKAHKFFDKNLNQELESLWQGYLRLRSWTSELLEIHRANINERTNRIIHILTIISTVFLPITFISSLYGMNFEHMPELKHPYGYYMALGLMVTIVVVMLIYMKRKRWF